MQFYFSYNKSYSDSSSKEEEAGLQDQQIDFDLALVKRYARLEPFFPVRVVGTEI